MTAAETARHHLWLAGLSLVIAEMRPLELDRVEVAQWHPAPNGHRVDELTVEQEGGPLVDFCASALPSAMRAASTALRDSAAGSGVRLVGAVTAEPTLPVSRLYKSSTGRATPGVSTALSANVTMPSSRPVGDRSGPPV